MLNLFLLNYFPFPICCNFVSKPSIACTFVVNSFKVLYWFIRSLLNKASPSFMEAACSSNWRSRYFLILILYIFYLFFFFNNNLSTESLRLISCDAFPSLICTIMRETTFLRIFCNSCTLLNLTMNSLVVKVYIGWICYNFWRTSLLRTRM